MRFSVDISMRLLNLAVCVSVVLWLVRAGGRVPDLSGVVILAPLWMLRVVFWFGCVWLWLRVLVTHIVSAGHFGWWFGGCILAWIVCAVACAGR